MTNASEATPASTSPVSRSSDPKSNKKQEDAKAAFDNYR